MNNKILYQLNIEDFLCENKVNRINNTNKENSVIKLIKCIQPRG